MALNKGILDPKLRGTHIKGANLQSLIQRPLCVESISVGLPCGGQLVHVRRHRDTLTCLSRKHGIHLNMAVSFRLRTPNARS